MCVIVDVNVVQLVFSSPPTGDYYVMLDALRMKRAKAVYGGELAREYVRLKKLRSLFAELERQGVLRRIPDTLVDDETDVVVREGICISNDQHIIALARVSNVRLLCTNDRRLQSDFKNPRVLKPRGSVYKRKSHRHLIRKHCR